jgi:hypothetical protein
MAKPAFSGTIEFTLTLRAFEITANRKASAAYVYTPPWAYYDTRQKKEHVGDLHLALSLSVWAVPRASNGKPLFSRLPGSYWVSVDNLLAFGLLPSRLHDELRTRIDTDAMEVDRRNRGKAGLPLLPMPEQL